MRLWSAGACSRFVRAFFPQRSRTKREQAPALQNALRPVERALDRALRGAELALFVQIGCARLGPLEDREHGVAEFQRLAAAESSPTACSIESVIQ